MEANPEEFETDEYSKYVEKKSTYPTTDSLTNHISQSTQTALMAYCLNHLWFYLSLRSVKPWQISFWMDSEELTASGFQYELGLDNYLYDLAKKQSKPVEGLESSLYLIDLYDSLPESIYIKQIEDILANPSQVASNVIDMVEAWKSGNTEYFYRNNEDCRRAFPIDVEEMVDRRNRLWLPKIEKYLQQSPKTMVIVGSSHLPGPDGLINQLRLKGFDVEQLPRTAIPLPQFNRISVDSREVTLEVAVESGRSYEIQDMTSKPAWTSLTAFFATNSTMTFTYIMSNNGARFFRLLTPPPQ
jgi:uncharacterized protein YbaP (TraB family)